MRLRKNIYLIGLMAAGKTTVGRKLARLLRCEFTDLDAAIEQKTGVSVSHIFDIEGEAGFRERETKMLEEIANLDRGGAVIATGGGVILRADNRAVLQGGVVVYLRADKELLRERLKNARIDRPLLRGDADATIARLLTARAPLYAAAADFTVDTCIATAHTAAQRIHQLLQLGENMNGGINNMNENEKR